MAFKNLIDWLVLPAHSTSPHYHRQLLLYPTDVPDASMEELLRGLPENRRIVLMGGDMRADSRHNVECYALLDFKKVLGKEFDVGIYNAYQGFRPNALLALAGTLRHAGRLIIICPPLAQWSTHGSVTHPHYLSHGHTIDKSTFIGHLQNKLTNSPTVAIYDRHQQRLPLVTAKPDVGSSVSDTLFVTQCQQARYKEIISDLLAGEQLCALTSRRGRGKSALLGLVAGALYKEQRRLVLVSTQSQSQVSFYKALAKALHTDISQANQIVKWFPPDHPSAVRNNADILLIDEAAALPLPVLHHLIDNNRQCLITTTTLGFEGSGLGFLHKFLLPRYQKRELTHYQLSQPVRWYQNDCLENVLDECLLYADATHFAKQIHAPMTYQWLRADQLNIDELAELFNLLSDSHYQTSPDDLMRLTDAPDVSFILARTNKQLVAAAVINHEGGARLVSLAEAIAQGERRVKGHLSAQSFALYSASAVFATHTFWRVNRISVAFGARRSGIGTSLISFLLGKAKEDGVDWLTSSYAADDSVNKFWKHCDFTLIRKGNKPDKASGQTSNLVAKPISNRAYQNQLTLYGLYLFDKANDIKEIVDLAETYNLALYIESRLTAYLNGSRPRQSLGNALKLKFYQTPPFTSELLCALFIDEKCPAEIIRQYQLSGKKEFEKKILEEATTHFNSEHD